MRFVGTKDSGDRRRFQRSVITTSTVGPVDVNVLGRRDTTQKVSQFEADLGWVCATRKRCIRGELDCRRYGNACGGERYATRAAHAVVAPVELAVRLRPEHDIGMVGGRLESRRVPRRERCDH